MRRESTDGCRERGARETVLYGDARRLWSASVTSPGGCGTCLRIFRCATRIAGSHERLRRSLDEGRVSNNDNNHNQGHESSSNFANERCPEMLERCTIYQAFFNALTLKLSLRFVGVVELELSILYAFRCLVLADLLLTENTTNWCRNICIIAKTGNEKSWKKDVFIYTFERFVREFKNNFLLLCMRG